MKRGEPAGYGSKVAKIWGVFWALPRLHLSVGRSRFGQPVVGLLWAVDPFDPLTEFLDV